MRCRRLPLPPLTCTDFRRCEQGNPGVSLVSTPVAKQGKIAANPDIVLESHLSE